LRVLTLKSRPDQGFGVGSAGLLVAAGLLAGAGAVVPVGAGAAGGGGAGVRGLGSVFLCLGASGSTSGPFCPQPMTSAARQTGTHRLTIFMIGVYRVPRRGSSTGTSGADSGSDSAVTGWRCG
jgi:hypothetical protein